MKKILLIFVAIFIVNIATAQSGYDAGNYYAYRGTSQVVCGNPYYDYNYNLVQQCQRQVWEQQYYVGYIYLWNGWNWYTEYRSGTYWTFTWYNYINRL